jgi:hypothetical protein
MMNQAPESGNADQTDGPSIDFLVTE